MEVLKRHYEPKPLVIAQRFEFHRRQQETEEGVAKFVSELRRLTRHCEFGAYLDEALRDRFVCGLRSKAMQKRLLTEVDLSLSKAMDIALSMEAAAKDARQLQTCSNPQATVGTVHETPEQQVDAVTFGRGHTGACYRCGKADHRATHCPFKTASCHNCGKVGHIKRACRLRQRQKPNPTPVHTVQKKQGHAEEEYALHTVKMSQQQPLTVQVVDCVTDVFEDLSATLP